MKMLELLAVEDTTLSAVVDALPPVHLAHEMVVTPWEQKGLVMRSLVEQGKDRELVLVDGVKVLHDGGWVLALPDPEEPVTHVWAEAAPTARPAGWPRSTSAASGRSLDGRSPTCPRATPAARS